jgi:hypothetical protein
LAKPTTSAIREKGDRGGSNLRTRGDRELRGGGKSLATEDAQGPRKLTRFLDLLCAGAIFLLAVAASMLIPKTYTGRIWIYGTDLALLFTAMLNLLRIQNASMRGVKVFAITANFAMSAFFVALMASVGLSQTLSNAQIPAVTGLLFVETAFSVRNRA